MPQPLPQRDFLQIEWDQQLEDDCRQLVRLAIREDLGRAFDWTTVATIPADATGSAHFVARAAGVVAGLAALRCVLAETDTGTILEERVDEGAKVAPGDAIAAIRGKVRDLLTLERPLLNFLSRLCGIATLTRRYVEAVAGTGVRLYDTRKTTPGWRRLEKYAVKLGGGHNHRTGLFDAVLIKDNHLAFAAQHAEGEFSVADAVRSARDLLDRMREDRKGRLLPDDPLIEIEVDTLAQLEAVLPACPDIVLLDNMSVEDLRRAVAIRDAAFQAGAVASSAEKPHVELEASGGVTLSTIRAIAETGVERISVGALTHSATHFDVGLDWATP